jgi:hypothetical protein
MKRTTSDRTAMMAKSMADMVRVSLKDSTICTHLRGRAGKQGP